MISLRSSVDLAPARRWLGLRGRRLLPSALSVLASGISTLGLIALSGWFIVDSALAGLVLGAAAISYNFLTPGAVVRLVALTRTAARYGERLATHDLTFRALAALRHQLFAAALPKAPHGLQVLGEERAFRALTQDVATLEALPLRVTVPAWTALVTVVLIIGLSLAVLPQALLLILPALVLVAAAQHWGAQPRLMALVAALEQAHQRRAEAVDALAAGTSLARLYGTQDSLQHAVAATQAEVARIDARIARLQARMAEMWTLAAAVPALTMAILAPPSAGSAALVFALIVFLMASQDPLRALGRRQGEGLRCATAQQRLAPLMAQEAPPPKAGAFPRPPNTSEPVQQEATRQEAILEVSDLRLASPRGDRVLLDTFGLTLFRGDRVQITGPSGCGKTTLLDTLMGLRQPLAGHICHGGQPLDPEAPDGVFGHTAMLVQRNEVLSASVRENLDPANRPLPAPALWTALEQVEMATRVKSLPGGLECRIGEGGLTLSGGEQRRLCLARVLLTGAPLLILDEPFEGLGLSQADRLWTRLCALRQTSLLVTHHHGVLPGARVVSLAA